MFKRILIAVDGNEQTYPAEFAARMGRRLNSQIALVCVAEPLHLCDTSVATALQEAREQIPADVPVELFVRHGDLVEQITHLAASWAADLIVCSERIRSALMLGADGLVNLGPECPIWCVV